MPKTFLFISPFFSLLIFLFVPEKFELINTFDTSIQETSGLSLNLGSNELLAISDEENKIFRLSFEGETLKEIDVEGKDFEGIATNDKTGTIFVIQEKKGKIIELNKNYRTINTYKLPKFNDEKNSGFEGITFCASRNTFFLVHEKHPGKLIEWSPKKGILNQYNSDFAKDYSGICYSEKSNTLWIISDKSMTISECNLTGKPIRTYNTGITKAEGIAIYAPANEIYIVSDAENILYVFKYQ